MKNLQKIGGFAALYSAGALLFAMVGYLLVLGILDTVDPIQKVAKFVENYPLYYILNLVAYVIWGAVMVVLALALHERLKAGSPALMQIATTFGLIWATIIIASGQISNIGMAIVVDLFSTDPAQAGTVWMAVESVADGLGSAGGEIVGGLWMLLLSWAALQQTGGLPRALGYLGALLGVVGIISAVPPLVALTGIFGLGKIVWGTWLGIFMLRSKSSAAA